MTAQVGDRFIYKGNDYSIVAISKLVKTVDHSEMAEKLRMELKNKPMESEQTKHNIQLFVEECFSLEMKDKAWWIQ